MSHDTVYEEVAGTASDFLSVYWFNWVLLLMATAPIVVLMPLLIFIGYVIENKAGTIRHCLQTCV